MKLFHNSAYNRENYCTVIVVLIRNSEMLVKNLSLESSYLCGENENIWLVEKKVG